MIDFSVIVMVEHAEQGRVKKGLSIHRRRIALPPIEQLPHSVHRLYEMPLFQCLLEVASRVADQK